MQFEKDLKSEHVDLFLQIRELLLSFDGIIETRKPRITTYSNENGGICHLRTMPHGVDIGFLKGARMEDSRGVLIGSGKAIRVLQNIELDSVQIRHYVEQAVMINFGGKHNG